MLSINKTMEGIMAENNIGKITQVIGSQYITLLCLFQEFSSTCGQVTYI